MTDPSVVVDLGAAQPLTDAELRAWGEDQRVFISSVMGGMETERAAVFSAVEAIGATAVWFEGFGGRDDDPEAAYLAEVAASDIYVGILGERYGRPLPTGYSATHAEYREAVRRGLRVAVWATHGPLSGPQRDFLDEVRVFRTTGSYSDEADLATKVEVRLRALAAEYLSPWVKIGNAIFRARRVRHDGTRLEVEARVRSDEVVAALEALRPGGVRRADQAVSVTWSGRTEWVKVTTVETETTAGRGRAVAILAQQDTRSSAPHRSFVDVALGQRSGEDMTELAVRIALFGEANPLGLMSFMADMANPFDEVEGLGLPEDSVQPVAHLLLTEALVGGGRAERLTSLQVGPKHLGVRRVALGWLPRRRYVNVTPEERRVDGEVRFEAVGRAGGGGR